LLKIVISTSERLALLTVAYGEYAMMRSSVFEWPRWFKGGQGDPRSGQPEMQRADADVDKGGTFVCSDGRGAGE
jgi:hypothetical protein